jgi:hypothetical protein
MDYVHYIDGVKSVDHTQKEPGIRAMNEAEKEWLNQFGKEFYGDDFEDDDSLNLHQKKASDAEIQALRDYISELRAEVRYEKDTERARELYELIESKVEDLCELYPRKTCSDANNARNRDILNYGKATNKLKLIPWESLDQNILGQVDVELLYILNDMEKESDED